MKKMEQQLPLRKKLNVNDNITFGIEIEFGKAELIKVKGKILKLQNSNKFKSAAIGELYDKIRFSKWITQVDFSVTECKNAGQFGGEVDSPILTNTKAAWEDISLVCDTLKKLHATTPKVAAGHIHVGSNILNDKKENINKLIRLWVAYEDVIYRMGYNGEGPRQSISTYASPLYYRFSQYEENLNNAIDIDDMLKLAMFTRNAGINFSNYHNFIDSISKCKNTIEFRSPNATLDPVVWQNNVNLFIHLMLYASNDNFDHELINYRLDNNLYPPFTTSACKDYNNPDFEKAKELADLIFTDDEDKEYFHHQYKK